MLLAPKGLLSEFSAWTESEKSRQKRNPLTILAYQLANHGVGGCCNLTVGYSQRPPLTSYKCRHGSTHWARQMPEIDTTHMLISGKLQKLMANFRLPLPQHPQKQKTCLPTHSCPCYAPHADIPSQTRTTRGIIMPPR